MKDLEEKLSMFSLNDQSVKNTLHVLDLVKDDQRGQVTYEVETLVVLNGEAKVVAKENLSV